MLTSSEILGISFQLTEGFDAVPYYDQYWSFEGLFDTSHSQASTSAGSINDTSYRGYQIHDIYSYAIAEIIAEPPGGFIWFYGLNIVLYDNGLPIDSSCITSIKINNVTSPLNPFTFTDLGFGFWMISGGQGSVPSADGWNGGVNTVTLYP